MTGKTLLRFIMIASWMILLSAGTVCAADDKPQPFMTKDTFFTELGFYTGAGYSDCVQGPYDPIFFILHMGVDMKRWFNSLENHRGKLSLFFEPQFNIAGTPKQNLEFGVGVGFKYAYPVGDANSVYILGSVGPHYITLISADQANGFIFADTIGIGMDFKISPGSAINIEYRFRHISNAGIKEPNYGIETHIGLIGYSLFF